jgi:hypothetical protein
MLSFWICIKIISGGDSFTIFENNNLIFKQRRISILYGTNKCKEIPFVLWSRYTYQK